MAGIAVLLRLLLLVPLAPLLVLLPLLALALAGVRARPAGLPRVMGRLPRKRPRDVAVVIVSCEGRELLERCLPPLRRALVHAGGDHQVIVVDNGSRDGTVAWLERQHPDVERLALPSNLGFGEGCNAGLSRVRRDVVVLLNNDMVVADDWLPPLLDGFVDQDVFAVTAQLLQEPGRRREETGCTAGVWRQGELNLFHDPVPEPPAGEEIPVLWAGGGATAFDVDKLRGLGGFDPMYGPAYVEDLDLSWRAWQRGWRSLLAPAARATHRHRSTSSRLFSAPRLLAMVRANQWLFHLKCLTDALLLREFLVRMPRNVARSLLQDGVVVTVRAVARMLVRLPQVRRARRAMPPPRIPDRSILALDRRYVTPASVQAAGQPRVLVVTAFVPRPGAHGGGTRMFHLLRELSLRWRLHVLAYAKTSAEAAAAAGLGFCEKVETILREQSPHEPNPLGLDPPAIVREYSNPAMRERIRQLAGSSWFDLAQLEYLQMAHLLPWGHVLPAVLTDHEVQSLSGRRRMADARGWARLFAASSWMKFLRFELGQLRRFDRVVVVTGEDAAGLLRYDPTLPVMVNNTAADVCALSPAPEPREPRLAFVGYYGHAPNVDAMVHFVHHILPRVRARVPDATLAIIGSAPTPTILALAQTPGVTVTGQVPELAPEVHKARVFVVPLRQGAGIRGKILEAWALGRAVVTTALGAAGLRCAHGVHLLIADEDEEFASAVVRLLQDDGLRARLVAAALQLVRSDYAWQVKAAEHDLLWQDLLDRTGSRRGVLPWRRLEPVPACAP